MRSWPVEQSPRFDRDDPTHVSTPKRNEKYTCADVHPPPEYTYFPRVGDRAPSPDSRDTCGATLSSVRGKLQSSLSRAKELPNVSAHEMSHRVPTLRRVQRILPSK